MCYDTLDIDLRVNVRVSQRLNLTPGCTLPGSALDALILKAIYGNNRWTEFI